MPGENLPQQSWLVAVPNRPFNFRELYHCSHFFLLLLVSEPKGLAAFVCGLQGHCSFRVQEGLAWSPGSQTELNSCIFKGRIKQSCCKKLRFIQMHTL